MPKIEVEKYTERVLEKIRAEGVDCRSYERKPSPYTGNAVYRLAGSDKKGTYLKIYINDVRYSRETASSRWLKRNEVEGVPYLLRVGEIESDREDSEQSKAVKFAIFTEVEGEPLSEHWQSMSDADRGRLLEELGRFLKSMFERTSKSEPEHFGEIEVENNKDFARRQWHDLVSETAKRSERAFHLLSDAGELDLFKRSREVLLNPEKQIPAFFQKGLCHRDVTPDNLLVKSTEGSLSLSGLVDFEQAIVGPSGLDLAKLLCLFDLSQTCRGSLLKGYGMSESNESDSAAIEAHSVYLYFTTWFYLIEYPSDSEDERRLLSMAKDYLRKAIKD